MAKFDWHSDDIDRETPVTENYKSTQNVRRFMKSQCGEHFKFDRPFMLWINDGNPKTMGHVADEWVNRHS
jgi:hypothetical protein